MGVSEAWVTKDGNGLQGMEILGRNGNVCCPNYFDRFLDLHTYIQTDQIMYFKYVKFSEI